MEMIRNNRIINSRLMYFFFKNNNKKKLTHCQNRSNIKSENRTKNDKVEIINKHILSHLNK
jgi:hypothetical protein